VKHVVGLLKPNPYNEKAYAELLQVLYNVFQKARKDGLRGLEAHRRRAGGTAERALKQTKGLLNCEECGITLVGPCRLRSSVSSRVQGRGRGAAEPPSISILRFVGWITARHLELGRLVPPRPVTGSKSSHRTWLGM
jgi:hypothetical protein